MVESWNREIPQGNQPGMIRTVTREANSGLMPDNPRQQCSSNIDSGLRMAIRCAVRKLPFVVTILSLTLSSIAAVTVTISPRRAPVTLKQKQQFTATVSGTTNTGVTWLVDGVVGGSSTMGTISTSGVYTPP